VAIDASTWLFLGLIRRGKALIPRGGFSLQPGDQVQITTRVSARDLVLHQVMSNGQPGSGA
jgi:hypothetical protein